MQRNNSILIIVTSQTTLGDSDIPTGFWMEELATPYYTFNNAGCSISIASPRGGEVKPDPRSLQDQWQTDNTKRFLQDREASGALMNTARLSDMRAGDFDAIVFPGGHGPMFDLAYDEDAGRLASEFFDSGRIVAAFCHGPAALVTAVDKQGKPLIAGRQVTCFSNEEERAVGMIEKLPFLLEDKLKELGGRYSAAPPNQPHVVMSDNLITGQNPASAQEMARKVLSSMAEGRIELSH